MTPSRSERTKRPPFMSAGRWTLLIVLFLLFLIVWFVLYIRSADAAYQKDENRAIRLAKAEAEIKKTDAAYKHVWNETVWVVVGEDADGVKWFVWERDSGIVKERESDGLTQDEAERNFESEHPGDAIVRIMPGWFTDKPVWEIRYVSDPDTHRQAIDFYSFKDGGLLETYDLPGK